MMMGSQQPQPHFDNGSNQQQQQQQQQKHDIFVGNLAFSTTEEQLHQAFSEIGTLVKVRMVNDLETGKPRGFAFIEFEDPQAALSAIRNMNDYELNGRRIRVNFSNSSHLEALAGKLGMDLSNTNNNNNSTGGSGNANNNSAGGGGNGNNTNSNTNNNNNHVNSKNKNSTSNNNNSDGTTAVADAILGFSKGEMYDVVSQLKQLVERDPDEARKVLCGHPQLPEAVLHLMTKLDMIRTPLQSFLDTGGNAVAALPPPVPAPAAVPPPPLDPRGAAPTDPRAAPSDPRARSRDPRSATVGLPPPPQQQQQQPPPQMPPPSLYGVPPPAFPGAVPSQQQVDSTLVHRVMSLTPQQIGQLPPDKQQSILAMRAKITSGQLG